MLSLCVCTYRRLSQKLKDAARAQIESNGRSNGTGNDDDSVLGNLQQQLSLALRVSVLLLFTILNYVLDERSLHFSHQRFVRTYNSLSSLFI